MISTQAQTGIATSLSQFKSVREKVPAGPASETDSSAAEGDRGGNEWVLAAAIFGGAIAGYAVFIGRCT